MVSVPVLSNTTVSTSASRSSAVPYLIRSPLRNSRPEAAVVTAGTARPSAQGQVMISTATAMFSDSRASPPEIHIQHDEGHQRQTDAPPAHRPAPPGPPASCSGSAPASATATRSAIRCSDVSCPDAVTRTVSGPVRLISPALNRQPGAGNDRQAFTGHQRPVDLARSRPARSPSTGIRPPGRTSTRSRRRDQGDARPPLRPPPSAGPRAAPPAPQAPARRTAPRPRVR